MRYFWHFSRTGQKKEQWGQGKNNDLSFKILVRYNKERGGRKYEKYEKL